MIDFFVENFAGCVWLAVLFVAMIPTLESKVAIPFALSSHIWGDIAMSPIMAFSLSCIGSMIPAIFVIWLVRIIKSKTSGFLYDKFVCKINQKYKNQFNKLKEKNTVLKKCFLLATFVAIPLPLTGVYTGCLIAGFSNLKIWQCFLSIFIGEIVSCLSILLLCTIFENSTFYILILSLLIIFGYVLIDAFMGLFNYSKKKIAEKKEKR